MFATAYVFAIILFGRGTSRKLEKRVVTSNPVDDKAEPYEKYDKVKAREKIERLKRTNGVHLLDAVYQLQDKSLAAFLTLEEIAIWTKGWAPSLIKERLPFIVEPHLALCNTNNDFETIEKTIGIRFNDKILGQYGETWLKISQNYQRASERFSFLGEPRRLRGLIEHFGFQELSKAGNNLKKVQSVSRYFKFVYGIYDNVDTYCPVYDEALRLEDKIMTNEDAKKISSSNDFVWLVGILWKTTLPTEWDKPVQLLYTDALNRAIEVSRGMDLSEVIKVIEEAKFYWSKKPVDVILEKCFGNASLSTVNVIIAESKDKRLLSFAEGRRKQLFRAI